jgi:hypothetical protein
MNTAYHRFGGLEFNTAIIESCLIRRELQANFSSAVLDSLGRPVSCFERAEWFTMIER